MSAPNLWSPSQVTLVRALLGLTVGMVVLGTGVAFAYSPHWRSGTAMVCVVGAWLAAVSLPSRSPAPFHPHGRPGQYLTSVGLVVTVVGLLAVGGWLLAGTPV